MTGCYQILRQCLGHDKVNFDWNFAPWDILMLFGHSDHSDKSIKCLWAEHIMQKTNIFMSNF